MIPISIAVDADGPDGEAFATALQTAVDSLANEALAPSTLAFIAANDVLQRVEPDAQFEVGALVTTAVHRAGEHIWCITTPEAYGTIARMGAHVALSQHDTIAADLIDAAERAAVKRAGSHAEGAGPRDPAHDAHQLREVIDARALGDLPPVLAVLTAGPETELSPADVCESVIHTTTPAKVAERFLMTFADDFSVQTGETP